MIKKRATARLRAHTQRATGKMRAMGAMAPFCLVVLIAALLLVETHALQGLGGSCVYDDECDQVTTFCRDRRSCACKDNFREESGSCIATVGARCTQTNDCNSLLYSACEENICTCREGYVVEPSRYRCLQVVTMINGPCQENLQCQKGIGDRSYCKTFECQCEDGYHYADWHCQRSVGLGGVCASPHNCSYSQSERNRVTCEKNECRCASGYSRRDDVCVDSATTLGASLGVIFIVWIVRFSLKVLE